MFEWLLAKYSWWFWLAVLLLVIFLFWLFVGGRNNQQPFIGLAPLHPNVPISQYLDAQTLTALGLSSLSGLANIAHPPDRSARSQTSQTSRSSRSTQNQEIKQDLTPAIPPEVLATPPQPPESIPQPIPTRATSPRRYGSKFEERCILAIERIYGKPFPSVRPSFLRNPETGCNLELDGYNDELKIGIECNGAQHYRYPNRFHRTQEEFFAQVRRDQYKVDACDAHGVYLITVPYDVPAEYTEAYIRYYTPEAVMERMARQNEAQITQHNII